MTSLVRRATLTWVVRRTAKPAALPRVFRLLLSAVVYVLQSRQLHALSAEEIRARLYPVLSIPGLKLPVRWMVLRALDLGAIVVTKHGCANFMPTCDEVMAFVGTRGG